MNLLKLRKGIFTVLNFANAELRLSAGNISQFPRDPLPQIAFSGRSNVGKSSLINTLLSRKSLARVSGTPGKTITVNFYEIDKKILFADLHGYGYAKRPAEEKAKWSALTDGYFTKNPNADRIKLVVQLFDSRIGPTDDDLMMLDFLVQSGIPFVTVATKVDKLNKTERKENFAAFASGILPEGATIIPFSSQTKEGKDELLREILKKI